MHKQYKQTTGFTLVELLIVVGILSILAIFALAALNPLEQFRKARDSQRKSDLTQVQRALEQYYQDHGKYPKSSGSYTITDFNNNSISWGGSSGWVPYMNVVPQDPDSARTYVYYATTDGQTYYLYAALERGALDPQSCNKGAACASLGPSSGLGLPGGGGGAPPADSCSKNGGIRNTIVCNYGVSSPNTSP